MPYLNSRGDIAHGVGGSPASLNNVKVAFGGVGGWLDDDHLVFANGDDGWIVSTYNRLTGKVARLGSTSANHMFAGGGHAAWWFGSNDDTRGLWATTGFRAPDAGLLGMGPDAALCFKPLYQSNGPTLVREHNGSEWRVTDGHADSISLHGQGRAVWFERMQVFARQLPPPRVVTTGGIWKVSAAEAGGAWWIAYYSGAHGIVLHPFDSLTGFSVLPRGDGWHTIRAISADVIRVAVATHEGEHPGQIWVRDYDVRANLMRDPWGANTWEPAVRVEIATINASSPPVVVPPLPPVPIPPVPEPEPMDLPADVHAIVVALYLTNLPLATGSDDQRRELALKIAQTVRSRKGPQWGWKSNHAGGASPAKDAIAMLPDRDIPTPALRQQLWIWDLFDGGTRKPNPLPLASGPDAERRQYFIPVDAIDHLAGTVAPPPPVIPTVEPLPPDLAALRAAVAGLRADVLAWRAENQELHAEWSRTAVEVRELKDRLDALPKAGTPQRFKVVGRTGKTATLFGGKHDHDPGTLTLEPIP